MLVAIDEVVVGAVVEEDETESDRRTAESWACPREFRIRSPGEDEEADGNEPAAQHHGNQASFRWWFAVVSGDEGEVVLVDQRSAEGREYDSNRNRNEHQTGGGGAVAFALLVNDRVGDKEHVQQTVKDGHVQGDEQDDWLEEEQLEGAHEEDS